MKNIFKKELGLTASPLSYIFIAFTLMVFIPNYPILTGAFFVCFGIFQSFQAGREANDVLYSAMLPIKKTDVVKSKFLFTAFIQLTALVLMSAFVAVRVCLLNGIIPYSEGTLMNANAAYLGYVLIIFTFFNIFFVGGFFKTAYKIGIPFLLFAIMTMVTIFIGEGLHFFPYLGVLNDNFHFSHFIVLALGIIFYAVGTVISMIVSEKRFNKIDL